LRNWGGEEEVDEKQARRAMEVVQSLVQMLDKETQIIEFWQKLTLRKRVKKDIKQIVIKNFDSSLVKPITERYMELAEVKFKR
tara:strand:- start:798 stop:1046 length:249 start_codon:yes stop_codon:yes gene_type:complete